MRIDKIFVLMMAIALAATAAAAIDLNPTVQISSNPSQYANASATITVTATDLMDNAGIHQIEFYTNQIKKQTKDCGFSTICTLTKTIRHTQPAQESYYAIAWDKGNNMGKSKTINITYKGADTPPTITQIPNQTIKEDSGMNNLTDLWQYASDTWTADENLTYSVIAQTNTSLANCLIDKNQYLNCTTITGNATGKTNITIAVNDNRFTRNNTFELTIENVNDRPEQSQPIPGLSVNEDQSNLTINLSQYFFDIDGPSLNYIFISTNDSALTAQQTGDYINITAHNNYYGTQNLTIIATDTINQTNTTTAITIFPVNDRPYFDFNLQNQSTIRYLPFSYDINASDVDTIDTITYTDNSTLFMINALTGLISFTPATYGNHSINITACDDSGASNDCTSQIFNLEIIYIPQPGFENNTPTNTTYYEKTPYEIFIDIVLHSILDIAQIEISGINITGINTANNTYKASIASLSVGNHTYKWHANYTNSLYNTSQDYNLEIKKASHNLTLNMPGTAPYGTNISLSCTSNTNQSGLPTLIFNGFPVSNPYNAGVLNAGAYNTTCTGGNSENYTITRKSKMLNITKLPVTVSISAPTAITYGSITNATCTSSINITPFLLINGTTTAQPDTTIRPAGHYNYTCAYPGSTNYLPDTKTQFITINKAAPIINLTLNGTNTNFYAPINSTIKIQTAINIPGAILDLYVNTSQVNSSTTPITNNYFFSAPGWFNITSIFTGSQNYTPAHITRYAGIATPLQKTNWNPATGSHFNQTTFTLSFNTNLNTSCRWSTNDLSYAAMAQDFTTTGYTNHSTLITGLSLGTNSIYVSCINETAITNSNLNYYLDNIIEQGSAMINSAAANSILYSTTAENSTLTNVNANNSIVNRSTLTNCTVINSTVKDYTGNNCYIINSIIDPSDVSGSTINASIIMNSNATNSYIDHSGITDSNIDQSTIIYSNLNNVTGTGTTLTNTQLQDVMLINAVIDNNVITNGTITQGNTTYNASINGTANLSQLINLPPTAIISASPTSTSPGTSISFDASSSTDPNTGQAGPYNNTNMTYHWNFGEGNTSTGITATHTYNADGTYIVRLTVTDAYGLNDTDTQTITISTPTSNPPSNGGSSGGGGGGGGGGGYGAFARTYTYDLESGMNFQRSLSPYDTLLIHYDGDEYSFKIADLRREYANTLLNERLLKFVNREIKKIDLDKNNYYDMEATFVKNYITRAEFRLKPIHELVPGYNPFPTTPTQTIMHDTTPPEETEEETEEIKQDEPEQKIEEFAAQGPSALSQLWSKAKNMGSKIAGKATSIASTEEIGGTTGIIVLLAVVIAGIIIYWIYEEMF